MLDRVLTDRAVVDRAWPIVIVQDRYGGTYSGGGWLAIAKADEVEPHAYGMSRIACCLNAGPHGSDTAAMAFWLFPPDWIAAGRSPDEAAVALLAKLTGLEERPDV